jgi:hypothetical protein
LLYAIVPTRAEAYNQRLLCGLNKLQGKQEMKSNSMLFFRTAVMALGVSVIVACRSSAPNENQPTVTPPNAPGAASNANQQTPGTPTTANANLQAAPGATGDCADCWVHVFDDKNYDVTDDNHKICGPGKWPNLRNLIGAAKISWGDEIESFKLGPRATVIVWSNENYTGESVTFNPGSTIPSLKASNPTLSDNISSIEIRCQ